MKPYRTPLPIPKRSRLLPLLLLMMLATTTAQSQYRQWVDTTLPPIVKPYGVGESELLIGAYKIFYGGRSPITDLWDYYSSVGINTVLLAASDGYRREFDSFLLATNRPQNGRVIVADAWKIIQATSAREIEFYPFDSSQSRKWGYNECVARSYDDDAVQFNQEYAQGPNAPREVLYDTSDAGTLALGDIAYNYLPRQTFTYNRTQNSNGSWRTVHPDSVINRWQLSLDTIGKTYYITLTGHLFEGGAASQNTQLFRIELWNEVTEGRPYTTSGGTTQTSATNQSFLYKTLFVLKRDLDRVSTTHSYNEYRTISLPIDLSQCIGCMSGPLAQDNGEYRRWNIKVYYQGNEKVALRSVALRDSIAEMMIGTRTESVAYRQALVVVLEQVLGDRAERKRIAEWLGERVLGEPMGRREMRRLVRQWGEDDTMQAY